MFEKFFKDYALKSMDGVRAKLKQAIIYRAQSKDGPLHHLRPLDRQLMYLSRVA